MSKITRIVVLATALTSLFGVLSATAGAITWHNTGNTAFTAHGGAMTLSSTGGPLTCVTSTTTGSAPAAVVGATYTATATVTFDGCRLLSLNAHMHCHVGLTGTTFSAGVTSGSADVTCSVYQAGVNVCHIFGSTAVSYTNPNGATAGRISIPVANTLVTSNPASGTCPLGNGERVSLTAQTITVTSGTGGSGTLGPIINRTA